MNNYCAFFMDGKRTFVRADEFKQDAIMVVDNSGGVRNNIMGGTYIFLAGGEVVFSCPLVNTKFVIRLEDGENRYDAENWTGQ